MGVVVPLHRGVELVQPVPVDRAIDQRALARLEPEIELGVRAGGDAAQHRRAVRAQHVGRKAHIGCPHHRQVEPGGVGKALDDRRFAAVERLDQLREERRALVAALGKDIHDDVGPRAFVREQQAKRERPLPIGVLGTAGDVAHALAGAGIVVLQEQRLHGAAGQGLPGPVERNLVRQTACRFGRAELHQPRDARGQHVGPVRFPLRRLGAGRQQPDGELAGRGGARFRGQAGEELLDQGALRSLPQCDAEPAFVRIDESDRCRIENLERGRRYRLAVRRFRLRRGGRRRIGLGRLVRLGGGLLGASRRDQADGRARAIRRVGLGEAERRIPVPRLGAQCDCREGEGCDRRGGGEQCDRSSPHFPPLSWPARRCPADRAGEARGAVRGHRASASAHPVGRTAPPEGSRPGARPLRRGPRP